MCSVQTVSWAWTVLTWNLQGSKHTDLERVAAVIAAESPDVVVLQEVRRPQAIDLGRDLDMACVWKQKHNPFRPFWSSRAEGAAILSPHELSGAGSEVVSDATSKRSFKRRIVVWAVVTRSDRTAYRVFDVHLSPHEMSDERLVEAVRIDAIATRAGDSPPTIVAGDMNNHDEPGVIDALPGVELECVPPTNPSEAPRQRLDHVLVPPGSTEVEVRVPNGGDSWAELSDHLPVTVRFSLEWVRCDRPTDQTN